ncbi:unnamed protein product [Didymodactylos carnosus]|uniref:Uncharacterized protein n=1 Tax=Didymodactylos carnosus TaxID=1234261 RepID=A0A8S2EXY4_9BILA|nr:unnamed protein product [Didymodactylos carnosus]CAF4087007.1 unnamed protein product [Didymodactylos carnosus]
MPHQTKAMEKSIDELLNKFSKQQLLSGLQTLRNQYNQQISNDIHSEIKEKVQQYEHNRCSITNGLVSSSSATIINGDNNNNVSANEPQSQPMQSNACIHGRRRRRHPFRVSFNFKHSSNRYRVSLSSVHRYGK